MKKRAEPPQLPRAAELAWLQGKIDKGRTSPIDPRPVSQIFADAKARAA